MTSIFKRLKEKKKKEFEKVFKRGACMRKRENQQQVLYSFLVTEQQNTMGLFIFARLNLLN